MTFGDVASVMELENTLFPHDAWSEAMLRSELSEPARYYIVAETVGTGEDAGGAQLCGYAGLRSVPPKGDVQTIAVAEPRWGAGIGTALLTELLSVARERGVVEVFLEVRSDNPRARELYHWFGFTEIGVRRGYYRDADAIVMHRKAGTSGQGA